jgi:hypothetical protein
MNKEIKYYTCRKCNKDFSAPIRQGRDPQYCSDECRGTSVDKKAKPLIWHLNCKACKKDWSMERIKQSGRKPHFCPDCYEVASKERHKKRQKERDRSYVPKESKESRNLREEQMVKWLPFEPLLKVLERGHIKEEDWAIATSRDRGLTTYMALRLGLQYTSMTRYLKPGAMVSAYKADEFAIRLRNASNTYLGYGVLSTRDS